MKREQEQAAAELQKQQQLQHNEKVVRHQRELEHQLMEKERRRQEAYEEFLKEKLLVDEIIRKIYEEEQMWVSFTAFLFKTDNILIAGSL